MTAPIADQSRVAERIFRFIADTGSTTPDELAAHLGIDVFRAETWLHSHARRGFLYRDRGDAFVTSCPWPSRSLD
jgi:hypothetical protein